MNNPLVSVVVIAYNSGDTIIETLESIKRQTYSNIELIISDDHSSDDTVAICEEWLHRNGRFGTARLLTVEQNTGTTANVNRAYRACGGEWIKGIAADDVLLPHCIEENVMFVNEHPEAQWVASKMKHYREYFDESNYISYDQYYEDKKPIYSLDASQQYLEEIKANFIGSPSLFVRRRLVEELGYYDEEYKLLEDIPMHLTMMKAGHKCYYLDSYTVGYRVRGNSSPKLFSIQLADDDKKMTEDFKYEFFTAAQKKKYEMQYKLKRFFHLMGLNNRHSAVCRFLYSRANAIIDIIYK